MGTNSADVSKRAQGIFEAICEQRFTSFPGGFDDDLDENEMKEAEEDDDEDPWADKRKKSDFPIVLKVKWTKIQRHRQRPIHRMKKIKVLIILHHRKKKIPWKLTTMMKNGLR